MARLVLANQAADTKRRVYFDLRDATDGITPETGEAGGQPQVSSDGGSWTNTGIGTLTHIGNGRYYADLTQTLVEAAGTIIETRYKSANTAETPGDSIQVVAFDPDDANALGLGSLDGHIAQTGDCFERLGAPAGASVSADVAAVKVDTAAILLDTGTDGVVVASGSKTGYSLASTGLDSIATTAPSGVATNFREMMVQTWRRFFKKATKSATQIVTYADDGSTTVTTQTISVSGDDETQGAAS